MKDLLSGVSDLVRISLHDLKKTFMLLRLKALINAMNAMDDSKDLIIDIPYFGRLKTTEEFDFIFIPDSDLKKDIYQIRQNPNAFLNKELKKLLKLEDKKGE